MVRPKQILTRPKLILWCENDFVVRWFDYGVTEIDFGVTELILGLQNWFWGCRNWFWGCRNWCWGYRNWFGVTESDFRVTEIDFRVTEIDFGVAEIDFGVAEIDFRVAGIMCGVTGVIAGARKSIFRATWIMIGVVGIAVGSRKWFKGHGRPTLASSKLHRAPRHTGVPHIRGPCCRPASQSSLACSKLHRAPRLMVGLPSLPLNSTALLDTQVSPTFGARVVGLQVSRPSLLHYSRWHSLDSCSYSLESLTIWISPTLPPLCYSILSTPLSRLAAFSQLAQILPGVSPLKYWKKHTSSCVKTCIWHAHADTSSGKKMRKRCG